MYVVSIHYISAIYNFIQTLFASKYIQKEPLFDIKFQWQIMWNAFTVDSKAHLHTKQHENKFNKW